MTHTRVPARSARTVGIVTAVALAVTSTPAAAAGLVSSPAGKLVPHRAVYNLELDIARSAADVAAISGRIVFEFVGSACEGYTQNMRYVMQITNRDGVTNVSDQRTSSWEDAEGKRFRFNQSSFDNDQPSGIVSGNAERRGGDGAVEVRVDEPAREQLELAKDVVFPVQHTAGIIAAAERNDVLYGVDLFDGSDKGTKVFFTNTIIGTDAKPADQSEVDAVANAARLKDLRSWPVEIAFFNKDADRGEGTPDQEMAFRLYENGVVRNLRIDYGTMAVKALLADIEFYPPTACPAQ